MNSVNIICRLLSRDQEDKSIRYCKIEKPYFVYDETNKEDIIPLQNWNREENGELFNFENNTLVGIKGRVENYRNKVVIVIESIMYLGSKWNV